MPNTKSAKKALRGSLRKRKYNLIWKTKVKRLVKSLKSKKTKVTPKDLSELQKALDKASKKRAIHKNKANRLKSRYAKIFFDNVSAKPKPKAAATKSRATKTKNRTTGKTRKKENAS